MRVHSWSPILGLAVDPDRGQRGSRPIGSHPAQCRADLVGPEPRSSPPRQRSTGAGAGRRRAVRTGQAGLAQRQDYVASWVERLDVHGHRPSDRRVFVAQQSGALRVIKNGTLLTHPFVTVGVTSRNERGLLAGHRPATYPPTGEFIYYTTSSSRVRNRLVRYTASLGNPDAADAASEFAPIDSIPSRPAGTTAGRSTSDRTASSTWPSVQGHHEDNARSSSLTLSGKLRINADGMIPHGQPVLRQGPTGRPANLVARPGNPSTFDIENATGWILDWNVGQNADRDQPGAAGSELLNAGFNFFGSADGGQGPFLNGMLRDDTALVYPFHYYPQTADDCAITGGSFYDPQTLNFLAEYVGDYFFADYCCVLLDQRTFDLTTKDVGTFIATNPARPGLREGRRGR